MNEAYRVRKRFGWRGWEYAPRSNGCECGCQECNHEPGGGCLACDTRCAASIHPDRYGGDIWIVEAGNPRKESMLERHYATGAASLPAIDDLMASEEYRRLLSPPTKPVPVAKRGPGRQSKPIGGIVRVEA